MTDVPFFWSSHLLATEAQIPKFLERLYGACVLTDDHLAKNNCLHDDGTMRLIPPCTRSSSASPSNPPAVGCLTDKIHLNDNNEPRYQIWASTQTASHFACHLSCMLTLSPTSAQIYCCFRSNWSHTVIQHAHLHPTKRFIRP